MMAIRSGLFAAAALYAYLDRGERAMLSASGALVEGRGVERVAGAVQKPLRELYGSRSRVFCPLALARRRTHPAQMKGARDRSGVEGCMMQALRCTSQGHDCTNFG